MRRVAIVQPYVPAYRVPFFDGLVAALAEEGIDCRVLAGEPSGAQARREDAADASWVVRVPSRELALGGRSLKLGGAAPFWAGVDGVIVPHAGTALDTYRALLDRRRGRARVGVWGHIRSYVNTPNSLDLALERWQLRAVDHVFAYTRGGADYAISRGVDPRRVTTVMNTVATSALISARASLTHEGVLSFLEGTGIGQQPVFAYSGGLDESKRIDFLARVLDILWRRDRNIKFLVAGSGRQEHLLELARSRGQIVRLGYVGPQELSAMAAVSRAFINPGRIGLLAVDALVLGRPILTTQWPLHGPEAEYLTEDISVFSTADEPNDFVDAIVRFAEAPLSIQQNLAFPTIEDMVDRFSSGVISLLD